MPKSPKVALGPQVPKMLKIYTIIPIPTMKEAAKEKSL